MRLEEPSSDAACGSLIRTIGLDCGMAAGETELQMVQRHVREGAAHIECQRVLLARLRARGRTTEAASGLLVIFEAIQREHEAHLDRLTESEQSQPGDHRRIWNAVSLA